MIPLLEKARQMELTASEQLLLDYIIEDPKRCIHQNLKEICEQLYISNATIVRFCQKIGFCGFNEFKFELRSQLESHRENLLPGDAIFDAQLSMFKDYIRAVPFDQLEQIYQMIHDHTIVYIYGSAITSIAAYYLYSILASLDYTCIYVDWRHLLRGIANNTNKDTLFIMMMSHSYTDRYIDILSTFQKNETDVVILCDESNETLTSLSTIFINTNEASIYVNDVDFSFKLNTLILVQTLIEMIYTRKEYRQQ